MLLSGFLSRPWGILTPFSGQHLGSLQYKTMLHSQAPPHPWNPECSLGKGVVNIEVRALDDVNFWGSGGDMGTT